MRLVKSLHQSYKFTIVFVLHLPTICRYSTFAASRSSSVGAVLLFVYSMWNFIFFIFSSISLRMWICISSLTWGHLLPIDSFFFQPYAPPLTLLFCWVYFSLKAISMMSVNCACVAVMNRQSKSTADRTVLEALCLQAFEDLIHKYSSKMHKILA